MINQCFAAPDVRAWTDSARRRAVDRTARTKVINVRPLRVRPAHDLPGNMVVIRSRGQVIVSPAPRATAPPKPAAPRPPLASDRYRADRIHARAQADRPYQPAPAELAAGRI